MNNETLPEPFNSALANVDAVTNVGLLLRFPIQEEKVGAFLSLLGELHQKSEEVAGLKVFNVNRATFPVSKETVISLYEIWEDKNALANQLAGAHVESFRNDLMAGDYLAGEYGLEIFEVQPNLHAGQ